MSSTSLPPSAGSLLAGAATIDITPRGPVFLYGYPHVDRISTGVHDPLECSALFLSSSGGPGSEAALFLANDLIFVPTALVGAVRRRLSAATGVHEHAILIAATHTHSGPVVSTQISNAADPIVPKEDPEYLVWLADRLVEAGVRAHAAAAPAELGLVTAQAEGVGSNRHDPQGATDPEVPILVVRSKAGHQPIGCLLVYGMHPTVLHEDSTLVSADFPYFVRRYLKERILPAACPILYFNGAAGDQSPRHLTRGPTFAEAQRLGENLGRVIAEAIPRIVFGDGAGIEVHHQRLALERRQLPPIETAAEGLEASRARFADLAKSGAPRTTLRTAECDVFGAEETLELARAATDGRLDAAVAACTPAEIQAIRIGPWAFVAWPGEFFAEYGLALKSRAPGTYLVTLANGELQGYIVTPEAAIRGCYEAQNAVFSPENGGRFVEATLALLAPHDQPSPS